MSENKRKILTLLGLVLAVCVVVAVVVAVVKLVDISPSKPEVTVINASLTQFNLNSNNNTLYYNLALDVALSNPSKTSQINYNRIGVTANYREERFTLGTLSLPPFNQGTKNTAILHPVLQGQLFVKLSEHDLSEFYLETAAGIYSIHVEVDLQIRRRMRKRFVYRPRGMMCILKVPLSLNHTSTRTSFQPTKCSVHGH